MNDARAWSRPRLINSFFCLLVDHAHRLQVRVCGADALDENGVVPHELRALLHTRLAERKHAKLLLKTDQPTAYVIT